MQCREVLKVGEKVTHEEFVKRLQDNRLTQPNVVASAFNDPSLKRTLEGDGESRKLYWERKS